MINMKSCVIVPTIRRFKEWNKYSDNFRKFNHDYDLLVIGEEEHVNTETMPEGEFFGIQERGAWFKSRGLENFEQLIPKKSHAETSFGLLVAHERGNYDMIVFIDDDTLPYNDEDFIGTHWQNLNLKRAKTFSSSAKWINAINPLGTKFYPRGFPYNKRELEANIEERECNFNRNIVVSQGLWQNVPDLNARDYLTIKERDLCVNFPFVTDKDNWITVCSMNLAFRPEVIPAFYQLPMGERNVDRFDDIWSGFFLKKILDHMDRYMISGPPLCNHNKFPRSLEFDIKKEDLGIKMNEELYKALERIDLRRTDYLNNYQRIASELPKKIPNDFKDYFSFLSKKMLSWTELIKKLS